MLAAYQEQIFPVNHECILKSTTSKELLNILQKYQFVQITNLPDGSYKLAPFSLILISKLNQHCPNEIYLEFLQFIEQTNYLSFGKFIDGVQPIILCAISHINFYQLQFLTLSDETIINIQPLTWIQMPNILHINLSCNLIVSLKPLAKTRLNTISGINLQTNLFNQDNLYYLSRTAINKEQFHGLSLLTKYYIPYLNRILCQRHKEDKSLQNARDKMRQFGLVYRQLSGRLSYISQVAKFQQSQYKMREEIIANVFVNDRITDSMRQKFGQASMNEDNQVFYLDVIYSTQIDY